MSIIDMAPTARKIVEQVLKVQPGEQVCIFTDTGRSKHITEILAASVRAAGGEVAIVTIVPREVGGVEPPPVAAAAIMAADVIIAQASFGIIHTETTRNALKKGARECDMWGFTEDMMVVGGSTADYNEIGRVSRLFQDALTKGKTAHLTTKEGTDLILPIDGRSAAVLVGLATQKGEFCAFPDGEAAISPLEGGAEGIMVNPIAMERGDIGFLHENITLKVKNGKVTDIEGGNAAATLLKAISAAGDDARNIAELGIGSNPKSRIGISLRETKKALTTGHIGIGDSKSIGGIVDCPLHMDIIFREPTISVDGKTILQDGKVVI